MTTAGFRLLAGITILGGIFTPSIVVAQAEPEEQMQCIAFPIAIPVSSDSTPTLIPVRPDRTAIVFSQLKPKSPVRIHKTRWLILSAGVYALAIADMHQTLELRNQYWWYETDPLARPFSRLPAPTYYATGLAMATGLNWLSWKMAHSRRWSKLSPIPQLLSITGNLYGLRSNLH